MTSNNDARYIESVDRTLSDAEVVEDARAFLNSHEFQRGPTPESIQNRVERAMEEWEIFDADGATEDAEICARQVREGCQKLELYISHSYGGDL